MIDDKNLLEMYRLKSLVRYNNKQRLKDETVPEHSFYVAVIALKIIDQIDETRTSDVFSKYADRIRKNALIIALLHDMPETEINDITYDVKTRLNLTTLLSQYEKEYYDKYYPQYSEQMSIENMNISRLIVDIADAESVRQYALNEISLGNQNMQAIYDESVSRVKKLESLLRAMLSVETDENVYV